MEVELPDPASIWKELGEFQSTVDSYVKQQADLADRLRRANAEFCQDQKNKLDNLESHKKRALHDIEILEGEKRRENEELDRLKKKNSELQRQASDLPTKVESHKAATDKEEQRASKTREVVAKQERAAKTALESEKVSLLAFQDALGMTVHKVGDDQLSFRFRCVDVNDPTAEFSFTVRSASGQDSIDQVALVSCLPPLNSIPPIIESYNKSDHESKLSSLVRLVRREFLAYVTSNRQ